PFFRAIVEVGSAIAGGVVKGFTKFLNVISFGNPKIKEMIGYFGLLAIALGTLQLVMGKTMMFAMFKGIATQLPVIMKMLTSFGGLSTGLGTLISLPFIKLMLIIGLLFLVFEDLWVAIHGGDAFLTPVVDAIKELWGLMKDNGALEVWDALKIVFSFLGKVLKTVIAVALKVIVNTMVIWVKYFSTLLRAFKALREDGVKAFFKAMVEGFAEILNIMTFKVFTEFFDNVWENVFVAFGNYFLRAWDTVKNTISKFNPMKFFRGDEGKDGAFIPSVENLNTQLPSVSLTEAGSKSFGLNKNGIGKDGNKVFNSNGNNITINANGLDLEQAKELVEFTMGNTLNFASFGEGVGTL
ncbi:MAG: hypothetical protein ACRC6E_01435, partial [Fusobacteriaceae bacterium]